MVESHWKGAFWGTQARHQENTFLLPLFARWLSVEIDPAIGWKPKSRDIADWLKSGSESENEDEHRVAAVDSLVVVDSDEHNGAPKPAEICRKRKLPTNSSTEPRGIKCSEKV